MSTLVSIYKSDEDTWQKTGPNHNKNGKGYVSNDIHDFQRWNILILNSNTSSGPSEFELSRFHKSTRDNFAKTIIIKNI